MATYVNNLRLTELATGEGSGTWGTTTNTNLELIGEALGYGSEAIANASTHTITVADGTADSARSFYLKLTGGGQACTVTLAPNTLSKVWMVENTTNSTLTFSQGSGANVAIAAGAVKMIATDGAGSGAVVYDLLVDTDLTGTTTVVNLTASGTVDAATVEFDSLSGTGAVAVTDILDQDDMSSNSATALATQQSIKAYVDSSVASFDTLAEVLAQGNTTGGTDIVMSAGDNITNASGDLTIDVAGDIILDANGDNWLFKKSGTTLLNIQKDGNNVEFISSISDGDIKFRGVDGASTITALTLDMSAAGAATFNSTVTATGTSVFASLDISGDIDVDGTTNLDGFTSVGNGTITGDLVIQETGFPRITLQDLDGTNTRSFIDHTGSDLVFTAQNNTANGRIVFNRYDNSSTLTSGYFDAAGKLFLNGDLDVDGTTNLDVVDIDGAVDMASTLNVSGAITGTLGTAAQTNITSLGTLTSLSVTGDLLVGDKIRHAGDTDNYIAFPNADEFRIVTGNAGRIYAYNSQVVINEDSTDTDFRVESDNLTHALFVQGSDGFVGVGVTAPIYPLEVQSGGVGTVLRAGTSFVSIDSTGSAASPSLIFNGDSDTGIYRSGSDALTIATAGTDRLTIASNGAATFSSTVTGGVASFTTVGAGTSTNLYAGIDLYTGSTSESQSGLGIYNATDGIGYVLFGDGSGAAAYRGQIGYYHATDSMAFGINGMARVLDITPAEIVMNQSSQDMDFRVESDSNANAFFLDATNGNIGMGGTSNVPLNIYRNGSGNTELLRLTNNNTNNHNFYVFVNDDDNMVRFGSTGDNGGNFAFMESTNTNDSIVFLTAGGATFNELGNDSDFRVESDGNTHLIYGDATNDRVGVRTNAPNSALEIAGDLAFRQLRATNSGTNSGAANGDYWKLGDITLSGSQSAEITVYGTDSYSAGSNVVGKSTLMMRGNNASTTIETLFFSESRGNLTVRDARWLNTGTDQYAIYIAVGTFAGLENVVVTGGTWTPALANTGSTSAPTNSVQFVTTRTDRIGTFIDQTVTYLSAEVNFNEDGVDRDFRVESDGNANMLFVDGGNNYLVIGSATANANDSAFFDTNGILSIARTSGTGRSMIDFRNAGASVGSVSSSAVATQYNTSSDVRLKENIADADDAGSKIDSIQVRQFDWKEDGSHQDYGMVAQELNAVAPEAVLAPEDPDEMMGVDYSKLVPMLIKEIQSLRARVADLES